MRTQLVLLVFFPLIIGDNNLKSGWKKPNAWEEDVVDTKSESSDIAKNEHSLNTKTELFQGKLNVTLFYERLIRKLFNRKSYIKINDQLQRTILFEISENEMALVEQTTDPRDWDEFVTKLFANSKTADISETNFVQDSFNTNYYIHQILNTSWLSFIEDNIFLASAILIFSIIFLHRKFDYSLVALGLLSIFIIGFICEYWDCNNELEIEKVIDLLDKDERNPCEGFDVQGMDIRVEKRPWYKFWSPASKKEECADYLRKQSKKMSNSETCRADHVLSRYIYNVFMHQFEMLIRRFLELNKKLYNDLPFGVNYFAMGCSCFFLISFLTLFFKYILASLIFRIPSLRNNQRNINSGAQIQNDSHHASYHEMLLKQNESINQLAKLTTLTVRHALNNGSRVQNIEEIEAISAPSEILESIEDNCDNCTSVEPVTEHENVVDINKNEKTVNDKSSSIKTSGISLKSIDK
ncbi:uncharacterized protein LOC129612035 isoform X2 [Condylostylus longicornis]|uniref:uncharacterized protein LOC129612035 isoform X2 n=1 Tax=Condylostylus longicornis TaxID=2530218 RepID=UPI00244DB128|nr:uncharacterized protein LOC129612035 isoform X2 [Condylostylus longicornis]